MLDVAQNAQVPRMTEDVNDRHGRASMKCGKLSQEFAVAEVDGEDHEYETEEGMQETQDGKKNNSDKKDNAASGDWELPSIFRALRGSDQGWSSDKGMHDLCKINLPGRVITIVSCSIFGLFWYGVTVMS